MPRTGTVRVSTLSYFAQNTDQLGEVVGYEPTGTVFREALVAHVREHGLPA